MVGTRACFWLGPHQGKTRGEKQDGVSRLCRKPTTMVRIAALTVMRIPNDEELLAAIDEEAPSKPPFLSVKKIVVNLRRSHPNWKVTERRLKKLRNLGSDPRRSLSSEEDCELFDKDGRGGSVAAPWLLVNLEDDTDEDDYVIVSSKEV